LRVVLRRTDYRRLLATRLSSQVGDGMLLVTAGSYVLFDPNRQATAAGYALAFTVLYLPYSIIGPFAGIVLDRWQRRQVLLTVSTIRAMLAVALALVLSQRHLRRRVRRHGAHDRRAQPVLPGRAGSVDPSRGARRRARDGQRGHTDAGHDHVLRRRGARGRRVPAGRGGRTGPATAPIAATAAVFFLLTALLMTRLERTRLGPDSFDDLPVGSAAATVVLGLVGAVRHLVRALPRRHRAARDGCPPLRFGFVVAQTVVLSRNHFYSPTRWTLPSAPSRWPGAASPSAPGWLFCSRRSPRAGCARNAGS
jgi:hypothetical protein